MTCGWGSFLIAAHERLSRMSDMKDETLRSHIFGNDIDEFTSRLAGLSLLTATRQDSWQIDHKDALQWNLKQKSANIIVGNPPYVGSTKIDDKSKQLLKNWSVSSSGKADLYIPFFEIGMENLNSTGILGYITVNTFYRSLNGRSVRSYFSKNKFDLSIIDFGGEQLFKKRSTYTCICIIGKTPVKGISYVKTASDNICNLKSKDFFSIKYDSLNDFDGWHLISEKKKKIISKIENSGVPLGKKFEIRNGFATLHNDLYVFKPIRETEDFISLKKAAKNSK